MYSKMYNAKLLSLMMIALLAISATSCKKDNDVETRVLVLPYFNSITISDNVEINIAHDPDQVVAVTGRSNDFDKVVIEVNDDHLYVSGNGSNLIIDISLPDLKALSLNNSSEADFVTAYPTVTDTLWLNMFDASRLSAPFEFTVPVFYSQLSGSGRAAFADVRADSLYLTMDEGTRCNMGGVITKQYFNLDSGSRFNQEYSDDAAPVDVPATGDSVWVVIDNGSEAWVHATEYLNVIGDGGSKVWYKGTPTIDDSLANDSEIANKEM